MNAVELFPLTGARMVPLDLIDKGRYQPRRNFPEAEMAELAASIKRQGVIAPVLLRIMPGGRFELVDGERRFRASRAAGKDGVPAVAREMTLMECLELQAIANLQRETLHELEEAESFEHLHHPPENETGYTVEQIAEKVSKSPSYVRRRLTLCKLIPPAKDAFLAGLLTEGTAVDIARMPLPVQPEAFKRIMATQAAPDKAVKQKDAKDILLKHFMLRLSTAVFPIKDATLVPTAGGCNTCPKRTGAEPDIFADVPEADTCTDPDCHATKVTAHNTRRKEEARAQGLTVLEGDSARALLKFGPDSQQLGGDYVYMDAPLTELTGSAKTLTKLLGTLLTPSALFEHPRDLTLREIVQATKAQQALRDHGLLMHKPAKGTAESGTTVATKRDDPSQAPAAAYADGAWPFPTDKAQKAPEPTKAELKAAKTNEAEQQLQRAVERTWRAAVFVAYHDAIHDADQAPIEAQRLAALDLALTYLDDADAMTAMAALWGWDQAEVETTDLRTFLTTTLAEMTSHQLMLLMTELVLLPDAFPSDAELARPFEGKPFDEVDLVRIASLEEVGIDVDTAIEEAFAKHQPLPKARKKPTPKSAETPIYPTDSLPPAGDHQGAPSQAGKPAKTKAEGKSQGPQGAQGIEGDRSDLPHWVGQMVQMKGAKGTWQVHEVRAADDIVVRKLGGTKADQRVAARCELKVLQDQVQPEGGAA